jgi:putrescine transport system ATP-binding protein
MFQNYALFPHLNVKKNIEFGLKEENFKANEIDARTSEVISLLELDGLEKRKIFEISGGQQQRVALARCLVKKPKLLLLDEPLAALDKKLRVQTQFELVNLQYKLGITFIIVTHDQEEAMSLSDRMAIMAIGKVLQIGNPVEVYEKPINEYVANFIGTANIFNITKLNNKYMIEELALEIDLPNTNKIFKKCLIRPEKISVDKIISKGNSNKCTGIIKEVAYLGSYTKYLIESNGFKFYSFMQNKEISEKLKIKWDDLVECSWNNESIYYFNE